MANKGFIKDWLGNQILPITRGELVLDKDGNVALASEHFLAKEGHPGLVTAAERALLSGSGSGGGISDIYNRLEFINNGLKVNGSVLNFYSIANDTVTATPINITSTGTNRISIGVANNVINFGLAEIATSETSISQIIKEITVDTYGRVTSVSGGVLTNAEIPLELSGKTIKNSILNICTTENEEIGDNAKAVANKHYVDTKILEVTGLATGALKFGGPLSSAATAVTTVTNPIYLNHYYKVTETFTIESKYLYSETEVVENTQVKTGDTLIVYPISSTESKFVYVPSGDDLLTLKVREEGTAGDAVTASTGIVTLQFSLLFDVTNPPSSNIAQISIPKATASLDGYLSKGDYVTFSSYASNLKVEYNSLIPLTDPAVYSIGTLTIGGVENNIYGKNNISSLSLNNGTTNEYNPILKFTETGVLDVDITYKGINGITIRKNSDAIEFLAANEIITLEVPLINAPRTTKYLTLIDGYKFGVQLGSIDENGLVTDGLTDFSQFNALVSKVSRTAIFEIIDYSLSGTASTTEYRYGNDLLKAAVDVTI